MGRGGTSSSLPLPASSSRRVARSRSCAPRAIPSCRMDRSRRAPAARSPRLLHIARQESLPLRMVFVLHTLRLGRLRRAGGGLVSGGSPAVYTASPHPSSAGLAVLTFFVAPSLSVDWLVTHSLQPMRESVLLTRPVLDPYDPRQESIVTLSVTGSSLVVRPEYCRHLQRRSTRSESTGGRHEAEKPST